MSVLAWAVAVGSASLAAVAAVADGAVLSAPPRPALPQASGRESASAHGARERAHRALAFLRVAGHGVAGGAVAAALLPQIEAGPMRALWLCVAALVTVAVAETGARTLGDTLGATAADRLAPFTRLVQRLLAPVVSIGQWLDDTFAVVLQPVPNQDEMRETTAEQFRQVIEAEPRVSRVARDLLLGVFGFGETTVSDVMVPRVDTVALERDTPWSEVIDRVRSAHHSRIPVFVDSIDDIVGILYAKDLLRAVIDDEEPSDGWASLVRPAAYIPPTKRIADQLREFKSSRTHIAIVVDEYGGTEGLVTIEDILEELVGEIRDEYDDEEGQIEEEDGVRYWVPGRTTLDELSDALDHDFRREEVSTIGGLVYELLGRVPRAGETLHVDGFRLVVERVVRRKVARVFIERPHGESA